MGLNGKVNPASEKKACLHARTPSQNVKAIDRINLIYRIGTKRL
jgi:hypothetical protein